MIEKELLNPLYAELYDLIGEDAMKKIYENYQGPTITIPKKLYKGELVAERIRSLGEIDQKTKQTLARQYDYSQRQIERFLKKK